jgi:BASS family bile acid:Na+ symporter
MLALAIFVTAGMAAGHLLGGPAAEDRTVLAIATAARHPALALAIAKANFPEQSPLVAGAVVIYLLLRLILSIPYTRWRKQAVSEEPRPRTPAAFHPGIAGGRQ